MLKIFADHPEYTLNVIPYDGKNGQQIIASICNIMGELEAKKNTFPKDEISYNFLTAAHLYMKVCKEFESHPTQVTAFATRNLYELYIQLCHVMKNDKNLLRWAKEYEIDHKELLEALKKSDPDNDCALHEEINKALYASGSKHRKTMRLSDVAKELGYDDTHASIFKIFSKYLHPTSYVVNEFPEKIQCAEVKNTFIMWAQVFAKGILASITNAKK